MGWAKNTRQLGGRATNKNIITQMPDSERDIMIPGMRGGDPRQMKMAMKRMGITQEEINDVEEVIIRCKSKRYVIKDADVMMMVMQGQKTFQVVGEPEIFQGGGSVDSGTGGAVAEEEPAMNIPEEDIMLVAQQANVSPEEALAALEECNGEPAEAIIKLMS